MHSIIPASAAHIITIRDQSTYIYPFPTTNKLHKLFYDFMYPLSINPDLFAR